MLALEPLWWDRNDLYETLLTSIVNAGGGENQASALELYLGSSAHHEATAATWQQAGFEERRRARILMLKLLEDEGIG
jgi:hypothetical protein